ncbi:MAG TPA: hypothetical protein VFD58_32200 [Blastocatellia bacterium]|nr:hypothetical protein [Blastocatellia bacterium]
MKLGSIAVFIGVFLFGLLVSLLLMNLLVLPPDSWDGALLFMIVLLGVIGLGQKALPHKISDEVISTGPRLTPGRGTAVAAIVLLWAGSVIWLNQVFFASGRLNLFIYSVAIVILLLIINHLELRWRGADSSVKQ